MNIVIIEDELLTAEDLTGIIEGIGKDICISAVLHSVRDAIHYFLDGPRVDLVFSDIQLGDGLSFEIFRAVRIDAPIIFCTAYDEYALDAIRSNGIDYILKPFTAETVGKAFAKYTLLKKHFIPAEVDYEKLIRSMTGGRAEQSVGSILVYHKDKVLPVSLDEIALFYIDAEVTRLHCFNGKTFIVNQSLDELEELSKGNFFRVNRQYVVSRQAVLDANHYPPRKYVVNLSIPFKEVLVVSKNRTTDFLQWLTRK
jgi:two-component system, LytTR family, response regulator LytT